MRSLQKNKPHPKLATSASSISPLFRRMLQMSLLCQFPEITDGLGNDTFDNVPYKTVYYLRYNLLAYYGESHYYCCFRGECYITPTEQVYIRNLFMQYGIKEERVYDDIPKNIIIAKSKKSSPLSQPYFPRSQTTVSPMGEQQFVYGETSVT